MEDDALGRESGRNGDGVAEKVDDRRVKGEDGQEADRELRDVGGGTERRGSLREGPGGVLVKGI